MKSRYYKKLKDNTLWPLPDFLIEDEDDRLQWILRYGSEKTIIEKRMVIASIVDAYEELIKRTQKERNSVCERIKGEK